MISALAKWSLRLPERYTVFRLQDFTNAEQHAGWWKTLNPPIYLVSVLPGFGVWLIAADARLWLAGLLLGTVAVVLLQHAINLLNDVSDWRLGADVNKFDSWVRVHGEDTRLASLHGLISALAGALLGAGLLVWSDRLWILLIAVPMVVLGYLYNAGPRPLSYTFLGEWVTGLCYGPGVFGCLWLLAGLQIRPATGFGALAFAALAMALLLSHQPPQIETDRAAGKQSFAVRYGACRTFQTARWLAVLFLVSTAVGIGLGETRSATTAVFAVIGVAAIVFLWRAPPNPRRILLPSTGVILAGLIVKAI